MVAVIEGNELGFSCWTEEEEINADKTWIRHVVGAKIDEFCHDLQQESSDWYRSRLPYCRVKSELNLFLPKAMSKTQLYTECSVCPYREYEGKEFYQANTSLEIDCYLTDGWNQVSPSHPQGTKQVLLMFRVCWSLMLMSGPENVVLSTKTAMCLHRLSMRFRCRKSWYLALATRQSWK